MSEPILKALMQLFAIMVDIQDDTKITSHEKNIVRSSLARQLIQKPGVLNTFNRLVNLDYIFCISEL